MFYGEFISLDEARAKGVLAPKAIHRHATPENVFFDDTRICYFNLSLSRQGKKAASSAFLFPYKIRQRFSGFLPEFCRKVRAGIVGHGNGTLISCCCGSFCL